MTTKEDPLKDQVKVDPEFTLGQIRSSIPSECFERSYIKSFCWLFHDLFMISMMTYLGTFIDLYITNIPLNIFTWIIWWYIQGNFFTGIWVLAHECGHESFTPNNIINNTFGFILHSSLLVPYFSWQYSHKQHHSKTNNLIEDMVHVPRQKYSVNENELISKTINRGVFDRIKRIFKLGVLGWPLYLIFDASGPPKHDISWTNHFNPYCKLFPKNLIPFVWLSDIGLLIWIFILYKHIYIPYGLIILIKYYIIPYLWTNFWLVIITFLQHTDYNLPRYNPNEWSWIRGAFGTIDRDYGTYLNYCHHHISDTHVVHHLFSKLPHYNAVKATNILNNESDIFQKYRKVSNQTWYYSLWQILGESKWYIPNDNKDILKLKHCKRPQKKID